MSSLLPSCADTSNSPDPLTEFGLDASCPDRRQLVRHAEATDLLVAQRDANGREYLLTPGTSQAWESMRQAAMSEGLEISLASAFRSIERQAEICRQKISAGATPETVFTQLAPPGYSEHHTGCAVDIRTSDCPPCSAEFEKTAAFVWLCQNAAHYGFTLSFPRNNPQGFVFEPWHWCFKAQS